MGRLRRKFFVQRALDGTPTSAVVLFDTTKAGNAARPGYMDYASVSEVFSMRRPRWGKE